MTHPHPQFAPVVPIEIARDLTRRGVLGNYHLLLAHDVVVRPKDYDDVYNDIPGNFVIMDNSVIELGSAVSGTVLIDACEIVGAKVLALPDVLMDRASTLKTTFDAYDKWELPEKIRPMFIPQGDCLAEWLLCAQQMAAEIASRGIDDYWVSVPKNFREKLGLSRMIALKHVKTTFPGNFQVHMLGFSDDFMDDVLSARHYKDIVRGIDSAAPIWLGLRDFSLAAEAVNPAGEKRDNFWDLPYDRGINIDQAIYNLNWVRHRLEEKF